MPNPRERAPLTNPRRPCPARTDSLHAGLGLSLAKLFAELLGFGLTAELDGGRRLVFRLLGPVGPVVLLLAALWPAAPLGRRAS